MIRAVFFDLDGTLADTAPDLGYALNLQRRARGLPPVPLGEIRPQASNGARGLLNLGFGITPEDPSFEAMREEFLDFYEQNLCRHTALFPGVAELLAELERRGLAWGVVTNKPGRFTLPLLERLGIAPRAAAVVSGDTCARPKPDPAPLLEASRRAGILPEDGLYVGDDRRDVEASRAAGMRCIVATYGYLGDGGHPETWGAQGMIDRPQAVLGFI
ncbi:MAG: phosphoglycolate phosphatase [Betaproteobacteria bacterium]|nr:phosphoglycolate phosphatase [Betaproteobacteria bacterium]